MRSEAVIFASPLLDLGSHIFETAESVRDGRFAAGLCKRSEAECSACRVGCVSGWL